MSTPHPTGPLHDCAKYFKHILEPNVNSDTDKLNVKNKIKRRYSFRDQFVNIDIQNINKKSPVYKIINTKKKPFPKTSEL